MKKVLSILALMVISAVMLFARGKKELVNAGSWVYDAMAAISNECGIVDFSDRAPLSIEELEFYMEKYDYDSLSPAGKKLYDKLTDYFGQEPFAFGREDGLSLSAEPQINAEAYFKSNDDIDWVFDRYEKGDFVFIPVRIQGADWFTMCFDAKLALNKGTKVDDDNYTSIPLSPDDIDINFPDTAYFSTGYMFTPKFGMNFQLGMGARDFGRTLTGSVVQSEYFTGASYSSLDFFSRHFRYGMSVTEANVDKYIYSHEISVGLFDRLSLTAREAMLVYAPMELRFLNPWTIFHGMSPWRDYDRTDVGEESHTCAYLGLKVSYAPVRRLRLYGQFAMTQFQTSYERNNYPNDTTPNGLAFQAGAESFIPYEEGYFHSWIEGVYTQPYIYIKESPNWSMVRTYSENMGPMKNDPFYEWIGTPFGPDVIGGKISVGYEVPSRWSVNLSYLLKVCGEYSGIKVFTPELGWGAEDTTVGDGLVSTDEDMKKWCYPEDQANAKEMQGYSTPHGETEYINTVSLRGSYCLNDNVTFVLQPSVSVYVNHRVDPYTKGTYAGWEVAFSTNVKFIK